LHSGFHAVNANGRSSRLSVRTHAHWQAYGHAQGLAVNANGRSTRHYTLQRWTSSAFGSGSADAFTEQACRPWEAWLHIGFHAVVADGRSLQLSVLTHAHWQAYVHADIRTIQPLAKRFIVQVGMHVLRRFVWHAEGLAVNANGRSTRHCTLQQWTLSTFGPGSVHADFCREAFGALDEAFSRTPIGLLHVHAMLALRLTSIAVSANGRSIRFSEQTCRLWMARLHGEFQAVNANGRSIRSSLQTHAHRETHLHVESLAGNASGRSTRHETW
jgi:hypothetical protein